MRHFQSSSSSLTQLHFPIALVSSSPSGPLHPAVETSAPWHAYVHRSLQWADWWTEPPLCVCCCTIPQDIRQRPERTNTGRRGTKLLHQPSITCLWNMTGRSVDHEQHFATPPPSLQPQPLVFSAIPSLQPRLLVYSTTLTRAGKPGYLIIQFICIYLSGTVHINKDICKCKKKNFNICPWCECKYTF